MDYFFLLSGLALFIIVQFDFYYTTLSSQGAGRLTGIFNLILQRIEDWTPGLPLKEWSGLAHLFFTLIQWIIWILVAGCLVFNASPDMVVEGSTLRPAGNVERWYYTGFVLSTLGTGDYVAGNDFSRIFTIIYTISGFGMLTTGITYLLSVTSAALEKKNLAMYIGGIGSNPIELFKFATVKPEAEPFLSRIDDLVQMIDAHTNNHLSFPIIHHFLTKDRKRSTVVHLASLTDTMSVLEQEYGSNHYVCQQLGRLKHSIKGFIDIAGDLMGNNQDVDENGNHKDRWHEVNIDPVPCFQENEMHEKFSNLLESQGWKWKDVYESEEEESDDE